MNRIPNLSPVRVFHYFKEICSIPHSSGDMERISTYCVETANRLGLEVKRDRLNNIVIRKPASADYENHPTVILQGHLDMVCEKDADCPIDFSTDGLKLNTDGEWIFAEGTTLGGDDGIAIAMAFAILEDPTLPHPPIEAVFTTDEETGMYGAEGLNASELQGKILLNIDSECEGVLTVSCAGGARAEIELPLTYEKNHTPCKKIVFQGLAGGHSGVEIHKGRINADVLMGEFLKEFPHPYKIVSLCGGTKDNAIPSRAECIIATEEDFTPFVRDFWQSHRPPTDPELMIEIFDTNDFEVCCDKDSTRRIAEFLTTVPNGVQAMSKHIDGLVETSLNLGQLNSDLQKLAATFSVRSSVNEEKTKLLNRLKEVSERFGGTFASRGHYPAWEYRENSPLRDIMVNIYENLFGEKPVIEAIHAGLECGFFCNKIKGLDAVSFGPDMQDIHTPRERLNIASTARTYEYLCAILKEL